MNWERLKQTCIGAEIYTYDIDNLLRFEFWPFDWKLGMHRYRYDSTYLQVGPFRLGWPVS